jgi:hypothetical protein
MNLAQSFRAYIESSINNNKAVLGTAVEQDLGNPADDTYGTWTIQPLDDEPPIFGVVSGQDNKPAIGSLVVLQFLDNQNAFITHIFDYDTRSVIAKLLNIKIDEDMTITAKNLDMIIAEVMKIDAKQLEVTTSQTQKFNATQDIQITGNGVKVVSNAIDLGLILTDLLAAITALNTAIAALTGAPPAAAQIATLTPNINTFNS